MASRMQSMDMSVLATGGRQQIAPLQCQDIPGIQVVYGGVCMLPTTCQQERQKSIEGRDDCEELKNIIHKNT